jgi:hypothetical protein
MSTCIHKCITIALHISTFNCIHAECFLKKGKENRKRNKLNVQNTHTHTKIPHTVAYPLRSPPVLAPSPSPSHPSPACLFLGSLVLNVILCCSSPIPMALHPSCSPSSSSPCRHLCSSSSQAARDWRAGPAPGGRVGSSRPGGWRR